MYAYSYTWSLLLTIHHARSRLQTVFLFSFVVEFQSSNLRNRFLHCVHHDYSFYSFGSLAAGSAYPPRSCWDVGFAQIRRVFFLGLRAWKWTTDSATYLQVSLLILLSGCTA